MLKPIYTTLICLFFSTYFWGQSSAKAALMDSLDKKAKQFYYAGQQDSCLLLLDKALAIAKELDSVPKEARLYFQKGAALRSLGLLDEALKYYDKSIEICKDSSLLALVLNDKAAAFYYNYEIEEAHDLFLQSIKIKENIPNSGIGDSYWSYAHVLYKENDTLGYLNYMLKADSAYESEGGIYGKGSMHFAKGLILDFNGAYKKAIQHYDSVIYYYRQLGALSYISWAQNNLSIDYLALKDYHNALIYGDSSYYYAEITGSFDRMSKSAYQLSLVHEAKSNHEKALFYYKLYESWLDSLANEDKAKTIIKNKYAVSYQKKFLQDSLVNAEKLKIQSLKTEKKEAEIRAKNTQQIALIIGVIVIGMFLVFAIFKYRESQRQKKVIEKQKQEVEEQKTQIEVQHEELEEVHKEISDSIRYAERLQLAILPPVEDLRQNLKNGFVLFQPKDVVSGDFYWMQKVNETIMFAAADCTGHGVPGAMVSVVCSNALNRTVNEFGILEPSKILDKTREIVIETFSRSGKDIKDGMDIALCAIDQNKLIFSGANNPLWILRSEEYITEAQKDVRSTIIQDGFGIIEYKANKQPVGLYEGMTPFSQTEVELYEGDSLFIFSDGFADQFGGERNKKLMYKPFKKLLLSNRTLSMDEQKARLVQFFNVWKGSNEQVDDVCVIGVKI